jgi:hypothetical protein
MFQGGVIAVLSFVFKTRIKYFRTNSVLTAGIGVPVLAADI